MLPQTRYAKAGDLHIAYQVTGDGALDLAFLPGFVSQVEHSWEEPGLARFFQRLGSFARLLRLDKRGTGLSDRVSEIPTLEQRTDDVRAVLDAAARPDRRSSASRRAGPSPCSSRPRTRSGPARWCSMAPTPAAPGPPTTHLATRTPTTGHSWPPSRWNGGIGPASRRGRRPRAPTNASASGGRRPCACPRAPAAP